MQQVFLVLLGFVAALLPVWVYISDSFLKHYNKNVFFNRGALTDVGNVHVSNSRGTPAVEAAQPVQAAQPAQAAPPVQAAQPAQAVPPVQAAQPVQAALPVQGSDVPATTTPAGLDDSTMPLSQLAMDEWGAEYDGRIMEISLSSDRS